MKKKTKSKLSLFMILIVKKLSTTLVSLQMCYDQYCIFFSCRATSEFMRSFGTARSILLWPCPAPPYKVPPPYCVGCAKFHKLSFIHMFLPFPPPSVNFSSRSCGIKLFIYQESPSGKNTQGMFKYSIRN